MRTRLAVVASLAVVLSLAATGTVSAFGDDKDQPAIAKAAPVNPTVTVSNKAASPSPAPAVKWRARPELAAVIFYSKKADTGPIATPHSRQRLKHALIGMEEAKKPVEKDGLGLCADSTGCLSIEENWDRFVNGLMFPFAGESEAARRAEAEREAEALRPFLHHGGTVLVLVSEAKDDPWRMPYGPLNMATDVSAQIKFAIIEHDQLKTRQANLGSTQPTPSSLASREPSVVKTASATDPGSQR